MNTSLQEIDAAVVAIVLAAAVGTILVMMAMHRLVSAGKAAIQLAPCLMMLLALCEVGYLSYVHLVQDGPSSTVLPIFSKQ